MTIAERLRERTANSRRAIFGDKLTEVNGLLSDPVVAAVRSLPSVLAPPEQFGDSRWDGLRQNLVLRMDDLPRKANLRRGHTNTAQIVPGKLIIRRKFTSMTDTNFSKSACITYARTK